MEIEILLTADGGSVFALCNRCIEEGPEDANCALELAALAWVQDLRAGGHVAAASDPGDEIGAAFGPPRPAAGTPEDVHPL